MLKKISFFIVAIIFALTYIFTLPIEANEQKLALVQNSEGDFRELLEKRIKKGNLNILKRSPNKKYFRKLNFHMMLKIM